MIEQMNKTGQKFHQSDNIDVREAVAKKQDEIDRLSNILEKESMQLGDSQKALADLKEENEVLKEQLQKAKDDLSSSKLEITDLRSQIDKMKDTIDDKQMTLEQQSHKIRVFGEQNKVLMETQESNVQKLNDLYNNNILLPKIGGSSVD